MKILKLKHLGNHIENNGNLIVENLNLHECIYFAFSMRK
jgi:hypothetical protein